VLLLILSHIFTGRHQGNPLTLEPHALLAERAWWEKAPQGLADARAAMEQAQHSAHQRGAS